MRPSIPLLVVALAACGNSGDPGPWYFTTRDTIVFVGQAVDARQLVTTDDGNPWPRPLSFAAAPGAPAFTQASSTITPREPGLLTVQFEDARAGVGYLRIGAVQDIRRNWTFYARCSIAQGAHGVSTRFTTNGNPSVDPSDVYWTSGPQNAKWGVVVGKVKGLEVDTSFKWFVHPNESQARPDTIVARRTIDAWILGRSDGRVVFFERPGDYGGSLHNDDRSAAFKPIGTPLSDSTDANAFCGFSPVQEPGVVIPMTLRADH